MNTRVFAACCFVGAMLSSASGGETVGLWLFDGPTDSKIENGTVLPNLVTGSALEMVAGFAVAEGTPSEVKMSYSDAVPADYLFGSAALTNRIGSVKKSVKLGGGDNKYSNYLRVNGFGKALKGKSFTCEVILRTPGFWRNGSQDFNVPGNIVGISGSIDDATRADCNSPALCFSYYQQGYFCCLTNNTTSFDKNRVFKSTTSSGISNWGNTWRHFALVWDEDAKAGKLVLNYVDGDVSTTHANLQPVIDRFDGLAIGEDSYFQVFGMFANKINRFVPEGEVAAVRISEGALDWCDFMSVWDEETPTTLAHWRFSGESGATVGQVTNEVASTTDTTMMFAVDSPSYSAETPKPYLRLSGSGDVVADTSSLSALENTAQRQLNLKTMNSPAYWTGSFTMEILLKPSSVCRQEGLPLLAFGNGYLRINNQASPRVNFRINGSSGVELSNPGPSFDRYDQWTRLVIQYDAANEKAIAYVDAAQDARDLSLSSVLADSVFFNRSQTMLEFCKGNACSLQNSYFNGLVDEIRITRGVLQPKDFLTPRAHDRQGMMLIFR